MSSLVEDLLLLARLDAGRPLDRADVDLTKLVLESVGDARVTAPAHRWVLELPDEPVVVPGDEQRLHQVLSNLLSNARRHTPAGTTVTVGAHLADDGRTAVVTVTDDGPGIPPELPEERLRTVQPRRLRAHPGLGRRRPRPLAGARHRRGARRAHRRHLTSGGDPLLGDAADAAVGQIPTAHRWVTGCSPARLSTAPHDGVSPHDRSHHE